MNFTTLIGAVIISILVSSCSDENKKPIYGESGLPKNCRAIVQANIDAYKKARYSNESYQDILISTDGIFDSLERNCGENGYSW